jgi:hypothetical protein
MIQRRLGSSFFAGNCLDLSENLIEEKCGNLFWLKRFKRHSSFFLKFLKKLMIIKAVYLVY